MVLNILLVTKKVRLLSRYVLSRYIKYFGKEGKSMSSVIKNDDVLDKYNEIWNKIKNMNVLDEISESES